MVLQSKCKNLKYQNMAKVLILEQSKSMRNILRERLEFEGFATTVAETKEISPSACARRGYDAILAGSDYSQVSELGVPFIIVTNSGTIDGAVMAVKSGAEDYLTTPVDMNRLLGSLRRIVNREEEPSSDTPSVAVRSKRKVQNTAEPIVG